MLRMLYLRFNLFVTLESALWQLDFISWCLYYCYKWKEFNKSCVLFICSPENSLGKSRRYELTSRLTSLSCSCTDPMSDTCKSRFAQIWTHISKIVEIVRHHNWQLLYIYINRTKLIADWTNGSEMLTHSLTFTKTKFSLPSSHINWEEILKNIFD